MKPNLNLKISNFLKRKKAKRFSLFFLIAFVFLLFSKLSHDYKQTIKLKLRLVNLDDEIIVQNDSLNVINAIVESSGFALIPFVFNPLKEIVLNGKTDVVSKSDYFLIDVAKNKFRIEEQLGSSFEIFALQPDTLVLRYSKMATKRVPVVLKSKISYAAGFDLKTAFKLDVDSVKVVGSSLELETIHSINTELLSLKDVKSPFNEFVKLEVSNYKAIEVFPKSVQVTGNVERFTEGRAEVSVSIINRPKDIIINYFPKTVTVLYYVDLESYDTIEPSDFTVECDFLAIKDQQTYLVPRLVRQPVEIKRSKIKQKRIDFIKL